MLSVIIPHFNQPRDLARGLAALVAQRDALPEAAELVVVDNNSAVPPDEIVAQFPGVRLLHEPVPGPGSARNRGIAAAQGDLIACIDADCLAAEGWLAAALARLQAGHAVIGGDVKILLADPDRITVQEAYESEFTFQMERYVRRMNFCGTGNMAFPRAVYDHVGPFAGLGVAEDRDWGHRATALGYTITWAPEMLVHHPPRPDMDELKRKFDRHIGHDHDLITAKRFGRLRWFAKSLAMALSPLAEIALILRSDRIPQGLSGRIKAFWGLVQIRTYRARRMLSLGLNGQGGASLAGRWRG